jgi:hypothetical protein
MGYVRIHWSDAEYSTDNWNKGEGHDVASRATV